MEENQFKSENQMRFPLLQSNIEKQTTRLIRHA